MGRLSARRWDLDAARGLAVVAMVAYHFSWDLDRFGFIDADFIHGPWQWAGRAIGASFLALMGASLVLHRRRVRAATGRPPPFGHYLRRGAWLVAAGLAITVATWFAIGPGFVVFGILHLLGVATVLVVPFLGRAPAMQLAVAALVVVGGAWLQGLEPVHRVWAWLGPRTEGPSMVDWYPLFPWFGFVLLGTALATLAVRRDWALGELPGAAESTLGRAVAFLGRHSLVIYLAHQPVLLGAFHMLGFGR